MSYDDIVEAQKKRDMAVAKSGSTRKRRLKVEDQLLSKSEKRKAEQEIQVWDMNDYYSSVLDLQSHLIV